MKILEFNSEAERFFGKKRKEVINRDYFQLFIPRTKQGRGTKRND